MIICTCLFRRTSSRLPQFFFPSPIAELTWKNRCMRVKPAKCSCKSLPTKKPRIERNCKHEASDNAHCLHACMHAKASSIHLFPLSSPETSPALPQPFPPFPFDFHANCVSQYDIFWFLWYIWSRIRKEGGGSICGASNASWMSFELKVQPDMAPFSYYKILSSKLRPPRVIKALNTI